MIESRIYGAHAKKMPPMLYREFVIVQINILFGPQIAGSLKMPIKIIKGLSKPIRLPNNIADLLDILNLFFKLNLKFVKSIIDNKNKRPIMPIVLILTSLFFDKSFKANNIDVHNKAIAINIFIIFQIDSSIYLPNALISGPGAKRPESA